MLIKEFRIVLPISVDEYKVAQLYAVAEASKNETGGGEGVEVLVNEEYEKKETGEKGQYTHKIYHLKSKVPSVLARLAPKGSLEVHEKAWNAYPYCKTIITNTYMKDKFSITIETWHMADMGDQENVHKLEADKLKQREVVYIDIADNSVISGKDYKEEHDPTKFKSEKTGRGLLGPEWQKELADNPSCPHMCAYKLVSVDFTWFGLQTRIENMIQKAERRLFTNFHRQLFCWMDKWYGLTMDDIRKMETETKEELDKMRMNDQIKGMTVDG